MSHILTIGQRADQSVLWLQVSDRTCLFPAWHVLSPNRLLVFLHALFVFNDRYGPPLSLAPSEMTNFAQNCVLPPPFLPLPHLHRHSPLIYPHVRPYAQVTIYDYQYWRLAIMIIPFGAELCCYWLAQRHKYGYDSCAERRGGVLLLWMLLLLHPTAH